MSFGDIIGAVAGIAGTIINSGNASDASSANSAAIQQSLTMSAEQFAEQKRVRDLALGHTAELSTRLRDTLTALGPFGGGYFDPNEVETEAMRRYPQYRDAADRAVSQVSGTARAAAITKGLDRSTYGLQLNNEVTANAALMHQDAYNRSFEDALKYISGMKTELYRGQDQKTAQRSKELAEVNTALGTPIALETALIGNAAVPANLLGTAAYGAAQWNKSAADTATSSGRSTFQLLSNISRDSGIDSWWQNLTNPTQAAPTAASPGEFGDLSRWGFSSA